MLGCLALLMVLAPALTPARAQSPIPLHTEMRTDDPPTLRLTGETSIRGEFSRTGSQLLIPATVNGLKGRFLLDTGWEMTAMMREFLDKAGSGHPWPNWITIRVAGGQTTNQINMRPIKSLRLGEAEFSGFRVMEWPFGSKPDTEFDGVIGADVLFATNCTLDVARRWVRLGSGPGTNALPVDADVVWRRRGAGVFHIPVEVAGVTRRMMLDSGAALSSVSENEIPGFTPEVCPAVRWSIQGYATNEVRRVTRVPIRFGTLPPSLGSFDLGVADRIGFDFFAENVVTFDAVQKKIWLKPAR